MKSNLQQCIENFGPAPRKFTGRKLNAYLKIQRPYWIRVSPSDQLAKTFNLLDMLYREGIVVWGQVVQANYQIFSEGTEDMPGDVVFSLDQNAQPMPTELHSVSMKINEIKHSDSPDPAYKKLIDHYADDYSRVYSLEVPDKISPNFKCHISTTYFSRKHLPAGLLCTGLLPLIVLPRTPMVTIPLPEAFWPAALAEWWLEPA
ncbi:MAG: hypothetical protein COA78_18480 [Blastopirellula sp.]|nr:MAG: hypothetical protein COA78_18480 [Blastopirellula sp.]